ncbi:leucine-rich repeat protein [Mycoplasmopsis anatis]|uniref:leucine-rich repeat protein n=1 Tax=Mycoplasmopsis anatis TaxID=171279 RepID=UPI003F82DA59
MSFSKSSRFIGHSSFSGCSSLISFILQECLNWIDNQAFENCSNLAIVNITENVSWIGNEAFDNTLFLENLKTKFSENPIIINGITYTFLNNY